MDPNSKTPARELRLAISRFPQEFFPRRVSLLLSGFLCRRRFLRGFRSRLRGRFAAIVLPGRLGTARRHARGMFLLGFRASSGLGFYVGLGRLLLFFFLLRDFANSGQLAQNLFALLGSLAAPRQLHGKYLLHYFVKLGAVLHAERLQLHS